MFRLPRSGPFAIAAPLGSCAVLLLIQWWPGLAGRRTPIWGDTLPLGWPLMQLQADALRGRASLLWNNGIYGGHPIFAEGQGGFAHPLNLLLALLATPAIGAPGSAVLLHVADLLFMALGMVLLGRRFGLGAAPAAFSALAVVFAPATLMQQNNIAIGGTLGFVPLALWALERCLAEPDRRSAALLAAMLSLEFLAGYPQTLHGLLIVMAARCAAPVLRRIGGCAGSDRPPVRAQAFTLAGAAALFLGLTAVQSLPLAQLVALSHRAGGVALIGALGWRTVLRGCAMGNLSPTGETVDDVFGLGSLLVAVPASLVLLMRRPSPRLLGYALGALACMLASAADTPLFPLLRGGLLPGMGFFRITVLYPAIATVPIALLAGVALERLDELPRWAVFAAAAGWLLVLWPLRPVLSPMAICLATAGLVLLAALPAALSGVRPTVMLGLLVLEVATLRLHPFPFAPVSVLDMPDRAKAIRALAPERIERRLYGSSLSVAYSMRLPYAAGEQDGMRRMLASLGPMTTLPRDIPSMDAALALPLGRRVLAERLLAAGLSAGSNDARLLDLLAVRFVTSDRPIPAGGFSVLRAGGNGAAWLYRNDAARPFAQGFASHQTARDAPDAAQRLAAEPAPALVIEDPQGRAPADAPDRAVPVIALGQVTQTRLDMVVRSAGPGWVVAADAPYPGWSATVDGRPTPVFPAQLLAKAVPVPAGRHELVLRFRSMPFEIGLAISLASLGVLVVLLLKR